MFVSRSNKCNIQRSGLMKTPLLYSTVKTSTEVGAGKQKLLRWLDWNFLGGYLLSLSINYVATSKDMGKKITTTVLCKDENFFWSGFYCNRSRHGNVATPLRFLFIFVFLCTKSFFKKSLKGVCTCHNFLNYGKVWTNSMRAFSRYFETKF